MSGNDTAPPPFKELRHIKYLKYTYRKEEGS